MLTGGLAAALASVLSACESGGGSLPKRSSSQRGGDEGGPEQGRLEFRPPRSPGGSRRARAGEITFQDAVDAPPSYGYVPRTGEGDGPLRLVFFLHGAGGKAKTSVDAFRSFADEERLLLLAPQSTQATWDVLTGGYGPDVQNIDSLLKQATTAYPIRGYTVAGFSDGASYALSLGIGNGDVFDSVMAFSPGFTAAQVRNGRPRFFISHGTEDQVLPIERCSRRIVPELESNGYDVTYEEFAGGHQNPPPIKESAIRWLGQD